MPDAPGIVTAPPVPLATKSGGSAAPPSTGVINVTPPTSVSAAPKPGSVKADMIAKLQARAQPEQITSPMAPPKPQTPAAPQTAPAEPAEPEGDEPPADEGTDFDLGEDTRPTTPPKTAEAPKTAEPKPGDKKVSPWKLVDEWKGKVAEREKEVLELKKLIPNEEARKAEMAEFERIKARNAELEKEIHHVSYTKSEEFKTKYEVPFNKAWEAAAADVSEFSVIDDSGNERKATVHDIMDIVNAPSLSQAKRLASERFPDFADDVMAHRKTIRDLYNQQQSAIEEARVNGMETNKQRMAHMQQQRQQIASEIQTTWQALNNDIAKDKRFGRFFTPTDGDTDGNSSLEKGFKLVDEALAANPMDPRLTPEQRKEAVRKHTAVRHRAAAFGRMARMIETKDARISELENQLKQFRGSEPDLGGTDGGGAPIAPTGARQSVISALHKLAKDR